MAVPSPLSSSRPNAVRISLILASVILLVLAHQSFTYCPDDAFITYRYSRNLIEGYGAVFNPGAPERVEGFSCPLYMLISAVLMKLPFGIEMIFRAKFFGLLCGLLTLRVVQKLAQELDLPEWAVCTAPLICAAHASLSISCIDGMETVFGALLATSAALWTLRAFPIFHAANPPLGTPDPRATLYAGLLFAGCALTRPEGLLMGLFSLIALMIFRKGKPGTDGLRFALSFLAPIVFYFLLRRFYYGIWLPNTYYAKGAPLEDAFMKGAPYLLRTFFHTINESPLMAGVGFFWWLLAIFGGVSERIKRFPAVVLPLMLMAQMIFAIRSGGDWMGGWRYMAVAMPIGMILALTGLVEVGTLLTPKGKTGTGETSFGKALGVSGATLLLAFALWGQTTFWNNKTDGYRSWASKGYTFDTHKLLNGWLLERALTIADHLNTLIPPGHTVAYTEMGVTPYYCPKIWFLDCDGLTDNGIATLPGAKHVQFGVKDAYTTTAGVVGPYLRDVRKPEYLMIGMKTPHGTTFFDPGPALDGAYNTLTFFSIPSDNEEEESHLVLWKRTP